MNFIRKNLVSVLVLAACVAGLVIYENYFASVPSASTVLTAGTDTAGTSADLLSSLSDLKAVTLDPSIFSDPTFVSLVDYGIAIPANVPFGRKNPFAPLSGVSGSGTVIPTASISTSKPTVKKK